MRLDRFSSDGFDRGASLFAEALWLFFSAFLVETKIPGSRWRQAILSLFGAQFGRGVVLKPGVRVKFPWRLRVGDYSWIGEDVWIDNLAEVYIGNHVCLSQGAYLCTGSHDWTRENFDLIVRPIVLGDSGWVGAKAVLAPGTEVGAGAVVALGCVAKGRLDPWTIYSGNPARAMCVRSR